MSRYFPQHRVALSLFLFAALIAGGAANSASAADDGEPKIAAPGNKPPAIKTDDIVNVPQEVNDKRIKQRLSDILGATKWFTNEDIRVENGVVYLTGQAESAKSRDWAADLAGKTEGVVAVVNDMTVAQPINFSRSTTVIFASLKGMWQDFLNRLPLIAAGLAVLLFTWLVSRIAGMIVGNATQRSRIRGSLRDLFLQLTTIVVWLVGILITAVIVFPGMTPAKVLTVLGLSSVALGFAFKDIFENFFAGVLILWRFPFDKGDFIICGDVEGKVEDITIRMTMIRQVDGQLVVVPNAMLFKNPVDVLTNYKTRRVTVIAGVGYGEDVDESREVIRKAVEGCSSIEKNRPVEIFAQEFASSSINFEVTWWTGSKPVEVRKSRDEVVAAVKRALDDAEIEIPFPYRTLTFSEPLKTLSDSSQQESTPSNGRHQPETAVSSSS